MKYVITFIITCILFVSCSRTSDSTDQQTTNTEDSIQIATELNFKIDTNDAKYIGNPYVLCYDKALMLWNLPIEEKDIQTQYGKAHVLICGNQNAKPLVLLHGMNASSTMWYPNIEILAKKYKVYLIDFLLEPGKSTCDREISETSEIIKWYFEIFDSLKLNKFSLIGASRGGWLATNIALSDKKRIDKLILLSPAQTFTWIKPGVKVFNNLIYNASPKRKNLRDVLQTVSANVDNIEQAFINQYYIATQTATIHKSFIQMRPFSEKDLKSLKIPVLVLIGDDDIINDEKSLENASKYLYNVETATISKAGHFLSIDQAKIVNEKMISFLEKVR